MTNYRTEHNNQQVTHKETPSYPSLTVVNLKQAASSVQQTYKNFVIFSVNNHCIRMAVMQGEFRWHQHPHSDECFLVVEGLLEIDLADGRRFRLQPGEVFTVPSGVVHRTRAEGRTVNLCFEDRDTYTDTIFVEEAPKSLMPSGA